MYLETIDRFSDLAEKKAGLVNDNPFSFFVGAMVIPPLIMVLSGRISYAASFNFCIGVIPPIAILGRSLL